MDFIKNLKGILAQYKQRQSKLYERLEIATKQLDNRINNAEKIISNMSMDKKHLIGIIIEELTQVDRIISKLDELDISDAEDFETSFAGVKEYEYGFTKPCAP